MCGKGQSEFGRIEEELIRERHLEIDFMCTYVENLLALLYLIDDDNSIEPYYTRQARQFTR